jgi:hypothetical protein
MMNTGMAATADTTVVKTSYKIAFAGPNTSNDERRAEEITGMTVALTIPSEYTIV